MKLFYLLIIFLITSIAHTKEDNPYFIFIHGLNANIDSHTYLPFFNEKSKTSELRLSKLPGHDKKNNLKEINKETIQSYIKSIIKLTPSPERTTVFAHSMGAILLRNYMPINHRSRFNKIIYLSPGVPPKYYGFKFIIGFLPNDLHIPSYSPKDLRLNDSIPVSTYSFLFDEIEVFKRNLELLPNEKIWIHENDEVVDVDVLIKYFPKTKVFKGKSDQPNHVFFL